MKIALYNRDTNPGIDALKARLRAGGAELECFGEDFSSWEDLPSSTELFLSLGGDGTFLQSLTFVRDREIPVAGINFGHLGFLTTARAADADVWVDDLLGGRYLVEDRKLLKLSCSDLPDDFYPFALNEISLQRRGAGMLSVKVSAAGLEIPAYWADGLVVATPTGSPAYSLSVGGPVVTPSSEVMVIAPIAPHNLNVRPLVVPLDAPVEMEFDCREKSALLTVDNRSCHIRAGVRVSVSKAGHCLRYVTFSGGNFMAALRTKLFWGEDRRNSNL